MIGISDKIAIFCGSGKLPLAIIALCQQHSIPYVLVAFHDQTPEEIVKGHPHFWTHLGTVSYTLENLQHHHVKFIIFAGAIKRPSWSSLKVDYLGTQWLSQLLLKSWGDDQLLSFLSQKLESKGFPVIGLNQLGAADFFIPLGILSQKSPSKEALQDIELGKDILKKIGSLDIGQAIVIQQGMVLGVEAIEGTDALIERGGLLKRPGSPPILVKMAKPQQDLRFDQPTLGLSTLTFLKQAGFQGIALEAGTSILLEKEKFIAHCNDAGLFFIGI
jgi:hypothetical protein